MGRLNTQDLTKTKLTQKERREQRRQVALERIAEEVAEGSLRVRHMTQEERRTGVVKPRPVKRKRRKPRP